MAKYASKDFICIVTGFDGADIHHIFGRKAHPEFEHCAWNQIKITHQLHDVWHWKNTVYMADKYPQIRDWLRSNEWFVNEFGKWDHDREIEERND